MEINSKKSFHFNVSFKIHLNFITVLKVMLSRPVESFLKLCLPMSVEPPNLDRIQPR
jgi:hypothetical protein